MSDSSGRARLHWDPQRQISIAGVVEPHHSRSQSCAVSAAEGRFSWSLPFADSNRAITATSRVATTDSQSELATQ